MVKLRIPFRLAALGTMGVVIVSSIVLYTCGCSCGRKSLVKQNSPGNPTSRTVVELPPDGGFVDVIQAAGINYKYTIPGHRPINILQAIGNGCAFLDYNNDGNLDILLVGPTPVLYRGDGHGHFTDVSHEVGLDKIKGYLLGCAVGDYDNDGYDDIYISGYRTGILLHNEHGVSFKDVTKQAGIKPQPWGTSCAFADVDNDGKLDLYIGNYVQFGPNTMPRLCSGNGLWTACGPRYYDPEIGVMYHQDSPGKFRDVTSEWGAKNVTGKTLGVAFADFNGSGHESLALANDEVAGDLMLNQGKSFKNIGSTSGTSFDARGAAHAGMGIDWGDYDNDGQLDLAISTYSHEAKSIYHNGGNNLFDDNSGVLGMVQGTAPYVAFGVKWLDYDNDGWLDIMFANGHVEDNVADIDIGSTYREPTQLFHNDHAKKFTDMSALAGPDLQRRIVGRGLAVGDYDNDGRVDVIVIDEEGTPLLLHNEFKNTGHWISIKLAGTKSNRDGIGAMVTVVAGGLKQVRRCSTDGSYFSASDRRVHVGIGQATTIETITVHWPSGHVDEFKNVKADQSITLKEGNTALLPQQGTY